MIVSDRRYTTEAPGILAVPHVDRTSGLANAKLESRATLLVQHGARQPDVERLRGLGVAEVREATRRSPTQPRQRALDASGSRTARHPAPGRFPHAWGQPTGERSAPCPRQSILPSPRSPPTRRRVDVPLRMPRRRSTSPRPAARGGPPRPTTFGGGCPERARRSTIQGPAATAARSTSSVSWTLPPVVDIAEGELRAIGRRQRNQ